eukprot:CAMPEP_0181514734 /NCGR_PEP_ID=MMETSP1110-20121109/63191_1 /TAXON_ID=174948 /ORGANISM="Symbiodinium sp., Strain CCMP421" /LENGTH=97 /DNA_ID=CAMNT_0023644689 /DNA_START=402 /DNA_END=692 /DNA_ORIENTATION=+
MAFDVQWLTPSFRQRRSHSRLLEGTGPGWMMLSMATGIPLLLQNMCIGDAPPLPKEPDLLSTFMFTKASEPSEEELSHTRWLTFRHGASSTTESTLL